MLEEKDTNKMFNVAVIATMSAGKSTVLNALLGEELLPSMNIACTAKVFKLNDVDGLSQFSGRIKYKDGCWSKFASVDTKILYDWNSKNITEVEIQGDFPHINNLSHGRKISFYDTPGPNNSVDKTHSEIFETIIDASDYSFVLFIMNATQFGVDDEKSLLKKLLDKLNSTDKNHKIIFVLNKIDCLDFEMEETPVALMRRVKAYLLEIGFPSPVIIPSFAKLSLDIRTVLNAYAKQGKSDMSVRQQKRFARDFNSFKENSEHYFDIHLYDNRLHSSLQNALEQKRNGMGFNDINIGEGTYTSNDLLWGDLATGIPLIEEFLEIEMNRYFDN